MNFLRNKITTSAIISIVIIILLTLLTPVNFIYAAGSRIDTISVSPGSNTVLQGDTATYTVTLDPNFGLSSLSANLSVTGLPAGCTASFSPNPVEWSWRQWDNKTATLTIVTSTSTPAGSTTFTIAESVSGKTCTGTLVVQAPVHYIYINTSGLPSGAWVWANYKMLPPNGILSPLYYRLMGPGLIILSVLPGTKIFISWPANITYDGILYKLRSAQDYIEAGAHGGASALFTNYSISYSTNIVVFSSYASYGNNIDLVAQLKSSGSSTTGKTIQFYLNNQSIGTATTRSAGIATLTYTINSANIISVGTYTDYIGASFAGDDILSPSSGKGKLTISQPTQIVVLDSTAMYGNNIVLTTILTSNGSGVSGKNIHFYLNSRYIGYATTDLSGVARLTYTINDTNRISVGTYTNYIRASFGGDEFYHSNTSTGLLTIYEQGPTAGPQEPAQGATSAAPAK